MVAAPHRKVTIRGGVWKELFVPLRDGFLAQAAYEADLGRGLDYYDEDEYELASSFFKLRTVEREIVHDEGRELVTSPIPYLVEGRVGTGKTYSLATLLHMCAELNPGIRILVIRRTFESLADSFKMTFEDDVLPKDHKFINENTRDRAQRKNYFYDNGSLIACRGFDKPGRSLSTEWDIIYFMEVTDDGIELQALEQLGRGLRGNRCPFKLFLMDCNPGSEMHWANQGCIKGRFHRIVTRWEDNPSFYNAQKKKYTAKFHQYTSQIKTIYTGVNYDRFVRGLWKTAQGAIFPSFEYGTNVCDMRVVRNQRTGVWNVEFAPGRPLFPSVEVDFFVGSIDFGFNAPCSFQVWAVDKMRRMYLIEEVYKAQQTVEYWAKIALAAHKRYDLERLVCDSEDPATITLFNQRFGYAQNHPNAIAIGVHKGKGANGMSFWRASVNLVNSLFSPAPLIHPSEKPDLAPRIMLSVHSLVEGEDTTLGYAPKRLVEEVPGYTYRVQKPGDPVHEEPAAGAVDHACDSMRYAVWWVHRTFTVRRQRPRLAPPGSIGEIMGGFEQFEDGY